MKKMNIVEMESIKGGDRIDDFCQGFGAASAVYGVGILANFWNPVGWGASAAAAVIGAGCVAYGLR